MPSGHLEAGESIEEALIREAREEVCLDLTPHDVRFSHVTHRSCEGGRIGYFFTVDSYQGKPTNGEPDKCRELAWFREDALPGSLLDYCRQALAHISEDRLFSTFTCHCCLGIWRHHRLALGLRPINGGDIEGESPLPLLGEGDLSSENASAQLHETNRPHLVA
ncbi:NUDIX domain-containing protein [Natronoglycomyces albus]|uniref:NUDIX domain-containing protein n=1 Tax=Natronoglycomyces albus TaxID=2811108 RepID=UPI0031B61433